MWWRPPNMVVGTDFSFWQRSGPIQNLHFITTTYDIIQLAGSFGMSFEIDSLKDSFIHRKG
jgi:hypothetical protein